MLRHAFLVLSPLLAAAVAAYAQGPSHDKDLHGDPLPPGALARLGTVRLRHDTTIVFAAFLPDGKSVVSVSSDGVACAWEVPSGKQIRRFEAYPASEQVGASPSGISGVTLSPDGKHLTAFCNDGFLRVWDWANARQLGKVASRRGSRGTAVFDLVYSPDGKTLMLSGSPRVLQLVHLPTGKQLGPVLGHADSLTSIWFTPDSSQIRTTDETQAINTWNAATGKHVATSTIKWPSEVRSTLRTAALLSPDGRVGVMSGGRLAAAGGPGVGGLAVTWQILLFDTADGKELGMMEVESNLNLFQPVQFAFSPDSKLLAVSGGDAQQKIDLYEVPSAKKLRTLTASGAVPPAGGVAPGGNMKGGGGKGGGGQGGVALPGAFQFQPAPFPGGKGGKKGGPGGVFGRASQRMLFSPDGQALAFQAETTAPIVVLAVTSGKQLCSLSAQSEGMAARPIVFSPDGRCLALLRSDGSTALHELATGQLRRTYGSKLLPFVGTDLPVAISPSGKLVALAGVGGLIHVWDALTGKELTTLKGHTRPVTALAFAPRGRTLASASHDTTGLVWDMSRIPRPNLPVKAPRPGDLDAWWQALAENDGARAIAAMSEFAAVPTDSVAWIKDRLKPAAPLDADRVRDLIKQLDDTRYKVREQATSDLLNIGEQLLPVIHKALDARPSPESEKRLRELREKMTSMMLQGERLRAFRAVEVLELIGTPQARQVLQALADGAAEALRTRSAQAALRR
jgi:WD40 repeat protein